MTAENASGFILVVAEFAMFFGLLAVAYREARR